MATVFSPSNARGDEAHVDYPTGDNRPVAETPLHFRNLETAVHVLERHFDQQPLAYVWGNMFVFYEEGNRHKHVSPDVFVALGVPKEKRREAYFIWEEGHGLDLVIELTSKSTRDEDLDEKMSIYRDIIGVAEYFLFDPKGEYLDPPLQGYRLREGKYLPIDRVDGRLPSEVTGLHLERDGEWLRFYHPGSGQWLPTPEEREAALEDERKSAEAQRERAETERERAETERERERMARQSAELECERLSAELRGADQERDRLRRELEQLRRRLGDEPGELHGNV